MNISQDEWLASSVGIAVTYVVFMQGMPVLVFQTLNVTPLRRIYNQRFRGLWIKFLDTQLLWIVVLFALSNAHFFNFLACYLSQEAIICAILAIVIHILVYGFKFLLETMRSLEGIEKLLSEKIVNDAISNLRKFRAIKQRDLDDLNLLARELPQGYVKDVFLKECGVLVEEVLKLEIENPHKMIAEIFKEVITLSIVYDSNKSNEGNIKNALGILLSANIQASEQKNPAKNPHSYLPRIISNCIKDIGLCAIASRDGHSLMSSIEKLAHIERSAHSHDIFLLGDAALQNGYVEASVFASRKLGDRVKKLVRLDNPDWITDRRMFDWLGLLARIQQKNGHAQQYAETQIDLILDQTKLQSVDIESGFNHARTYFYRALIDFSTADAILELQQKHFPTFTAAR